MKGNPATRSSSMIVIQSLSLFIEHIIASQEIIVVII